MSETEWYEVVGSGDTSLRQGDLLTGLRVIFTIEDGGGGIQGEDAIIDAIVLTQTCDLDREDAESVLVAKVELWAKVVADNGWDTGRRKSTRKMVQQGKVIHFSLLPPNTPQPEIDWSVVNFRNVYSIPKSNVQKHVAKQGPRLRLTPPHRELVSQAFAMCFMRVAVADDLERFRDEGA